MEYKRIRPELDNFKLVEYKFYNETVRLALPSFFQERPLEERQRFIPMAAIDKIICFANQKRDITLSLTMTEMPFTEDKMQEQIRTQQLMVNRMLPGCRTFGGGTKQIRDTLLGCITYGANSVERYTYNIMFFFEAEGKLVTGVLSAPYENHQMWMSVFMLMADTLQVAKKKIS